VLFLFVIMLVNLDEAAHERQFNRQWWLALLCVAGIGAEVFYFIHKGVDTFDYPRPGALSVGGNTEMIADVLFSQYLVPFEVASVLLLVAIIGSVVMAKKRIS
jgi:NADH-quinone oxidoreductase subunit J